MYEQLDEIESSKNTKKKYSGIALLFTMMTYSIFVFLIYKTMENDAYVEPSILLHSFEIIISLGMVFSILSFAKREPESVRKWVAGILNTLIFLLMTLSMIYETFYL